MASTSSHDGAMTRSPDVASTVDTALAPIRSTSPSSSKPRGTISNTAKRRSAAIPLDKVRLDVLLISGQRHPFLVDPTSSVSQVRQRIFDEWPAEWPPRPISPASMRVLHLGHILDDRTVLNGTQGSALQPGVMAPGKSTVIHLLVRQEPAKGTDDGETPKDKPKRAELQDEEHGAGCCCVIA